MEWTKFVRKKRIEKRLSVELAPITIRSKSLFQEYMKNNRFKEWSIIKEELLQKEGPICWICGKESLQLHIHEFWDYNDEENTSSLREIHHLCDMCHKLKRTDFWFFTDYGKEQLKTLGLCREDLINHFCKVNNCSLEDFSKQWSSAIKLWKKRSQFDWQQDFGKYQLKF